MMDYRAIVAGTALALAAPFVAGAPPAAGTWSGSFTLPAAAEPVRVSVATSGTVVLGPGHVPELRTRVTVNGARIRFSVPGRPAPIAFDGTVRNGRLAGVVRQGAARGTFSLRRGALSRDRGLGAYRLASGHTLGVFGADGPRIGVDFETGAVGGLFAAGAGYTVGSGILTRGTPVGTARLGGAEGTWLGETATRLPGRSLEVRFGSLAGTLWLPAGGGRHPAVALAHGSGATPRSTAGALAPYFASRGIAVLAYDKRGTGQSGGDWPGERASADAIDLYARDAAAAVRFLAAQPEVDPARVGLAGQSQAGWVMALAAARERAVRWVVSYSGPAVSVEESDLWGRLAGQGGTPAVPLDQAERQVRALGRSGFDPLPSLRTLRIPLLYLLGGNDRHTPTALSAERLRPLQADHDLEVRVFPRGDHFLIDSARGLSAELAASGRYAEGLWSTIDEWLAAHKLRG